VQKIIEQLERARELIVAGTYGVFGIFRVG
jgi:hypothetical protein